MHRIWLLLPGLVVVYFGRALYFHLRYRFLREVETQWRAYVMAQHPTYDDPGVRWLEERTLKVKRLIEEAGSAPGDQSIMQPAGYGYLAPATINVLQNWLRPNKEIIQLVSTTLIRAQGHYKDERDRNLNPLSWIESLVFLPRNVISSVDPRVPKWVKDVAQIAYWIASAVWAIHKTMSG